MSEIKMIDQNSFEEEVLKVQDRPVFIDFFTESCQPCAGLRESMERLAPEYGDKIKLCAYEIVLENLRSDAVVKKHQVMSFPTLMFFRKGEKVEEAFGNVEENELKALFDKHIAEF